MDVPKLPDWSREDYEEELEFLWHELASMCEHLAETGTRMLALFEGRDAAGKGGAIRRLTWNLDPDQARVWSPSKPTERERGQWYFQRFVPGLPADGELGLYDRSWYNRAGVERVMGFASDLEVETFLEAVPAFERQLVADGTVLVKFYLDLTREEQTKRLRKRREDPLKRWKIGSIDSVALEKWDDYTRARDGMLSRTQHADGPWTVVRADEKKAARLEIIRHLLAQIDYGSKHPGRLSPDPAVLGAWSPEHHEVGWLAK